MSPGDLVAVLSDGFFEAADYEGRQFGVDRVVEVISGHRHQTPGRILTALREAVATFTEGAPASDDRTAIIVKRTE